MSAEELSEYERLRLENIEKNKAMLAMLGLEPDAAPAAIDAIPY